MGSHSKLANPESLERLRVQGSALGYDTIDLVGSFCENLVRCPLGMVFYFRINFKKAFSSGKDVLDSSCQ